MDAYSGVMDQDTEDTRVTRVQAARKAGVSPRTISRWKEMGLLKDVQYGTDWRTPATYSLKEVMRARDMRTVRLPDDD